MGPTAGLDGRKISLSPGFDPGPSSPYSVAIPTERPSTHTRREQRKFLGVLQAFYFSSSFFVLFLSIPSTS